MDKHDNLKEKVQQTKKKGTWKIPDQLSFLAIVKNICVMVVQIPILLKIKYLMFSLPIHFNISKMQILHFKLLQRRFINESKSKFKSLYIYSYIHINCSMVKYIENYALYQSIGSGVYGKVYRAINNNDKKQYAIKVIPIAKFRENKKLEQCTVNEINILTNIEANQHIIRYFDMLKTSNNFYFIYQYCNGGTLESLLTRQGKLSQQSALLIFKQLLEAFQVLNKYNIMHRDLKPDNIFFHNGVIKLGDFGFCKNLNSADQMAKTMLGSPIYMAPQVLRGEIYSNKADIWSLGVVLYEMLFGHCPFQSNSIAKLIEVLNNKQLEFPEKISGFLKDLIQRMLTKDPGKRTGWMEMFQIKISNDGLLENDKIKSISSLNEAKFSDQLGSLTSTKYTPSNLNVSLKEGQFQQALGNISQSTGSGISNSNSNNQNNGHTQSQSPQNQYQMVGNQTTFKKNRASTQPQGINPASNNVISQPQTTSTNYIQNNTSQQQALTQQPNNLVSPNNAVNSKITEEHKFILEGVKLSMQIVDSRIPNFSGYAHLVLSKNVAFLQSLIQRPFRKQIIEILEKQLKDIKADKDFVTSKMFAYELKGLDDWKKYMRGKFFEDEKFIALWYRMVNFLNSTGAINLNMNLSYSQMAQNVKSILY